MMDDKTPSNPSPEGTVDFVPAADGTHSMNRVPSSDTELALDLAVEYLAAQEEGRPLDLGELCRERPDLISKVKGYLGGAAMFAEAGGVAGNAVPELPDGEELPEVIGRYVVKGRIGRGGMGVVYRAVDTAFGREVAVKVLQAKYGPESSVARRFSDEARITGQLQHPAIPAVHDLGTLPDGRPFLAMKLIKGDTFDDLLKARPEARADQGRFMAAFESVCQGVAYAHSKGVIHRDLKPANVMVGAFGEVQVMDWGLAKVLKESRLETSSPEEPSSGTAILSLRESDSSFTQAGSVLGTPAFMPPEQAVGAVDRIDARSDVFGLGGFLCAILTGKPPFVGTNAETTRQMAALGKVADAFGRLDASGAEPDLIALCKRCLAPEQSDRPADAGEVATAVAKLRAEADERARQAELDRVKAELRIEGERQKAEEQQKRRRVQLTLAGVVLVVVFGGGIAAVQVQLQRERDRVAGEKQLAEVTRQKERETRAASLVESLAGADITAVPRIIEDLADLRDLAEPKLVERISIAKLGSKERLHVSLALLPGDAKQVDFLYGRLLDAEPHEVMVIRDALLPHKDTLKATLWEIVESPWKGKESQRLRAAAALAKFVPDSEKWEKACGLVVNELVVENPVFIGKWSEAFRPVKNRLLKKLAEVYRDVRPELTAERSLATNILADYASDQPQLLADLLMDANEKQFAAMYPKLKNREEQGLPILLREIDKSLPIEMHSSDDKREALAKRQANAAVAVLRMNKLEKVWPLLKHSSDPRLRSYIVHKFGPLGADATMIVKQLEVEKDITIRRALVLSLGEFKESDFALDERKTLMSKLQKMYRSENDAGIHAATEWLLKRWNQEAWLKQVNDEWAKDGVQRAKRLKEIFTLLTKEKEKSLPQWYVNTQGQTYVVLSGPAEFTMGSPISEKDRTDNEVQHRRRISRSFVIASKSVTQLQFRTLTGGKYRIDDKYSRFPDLPMVGINWFMAADYCNLLSKSEGIPEEQWCYEIKGKVPDFVGTRLKKNYLQLAGYRLPTEAEMEYATRAGAKTSRYYGETEELLGHFAWYAKNSRDALREVGLKKPNDFGLFDVQGNCFVWCQEGFADYPKNGEGIVLEDKEVAEDQLEIKSTSKRVLRGGSFFYQASNARSADRDNLEPVHSYDFNGFRPVKTIVFEE